MLRAFYRWAIVCPLVALAGCHAGPGRAPLAAAPKPLGPTVRLFGEVEAKQDALERTLLQHIPPGTPVDQAQAMLREQGFDCKSGEGEERFAPAGRNPHGVVLPQKAWKRASAGTSRRKVFCNATLYAEADEWHLLPYHIHVLLIFDEARAVESLDVGLRAETHPHSRYFERHPDLHSPAGLPLEDARTRMTSHGFRCRDESPDRGRPRVSCERFVEGVLGGSITRVSLFADEAGVVREAVVDGPGWFDAERVMLPRDGDSTAWAVSKVPLYPVRLFCRYALYALAISVQCALTH